MSAYDLPVDVWSELMRRGCTLYDLCKYVIGASSMKNIKINTNKA